MHFLFVFFSPWEVFKYPEEQKLTNMSLHKLTVHLSQQFSGDKTSLLFSIVKTVNPDTNHFTLATYLVRSLSTLLIKCTNADDFWH